jgi:hypothetical protein
MSVRALPTLLLVIALVHPTAGGRQGPDDPALRAAVERFFTAQETEDVEAYLALWSDSSRSPQRRAMLKFVFSTGDDRFSDIEIIRVTPAATGVRVRVSATRDRTEQGRTPDAVPVTRRSRMLVSLTYTREGTEWKLLREAPAADDLAQALLESTSTAERDALLGAEPELLTDRLLIALSGRGTEPRRWLSS